MTKKELFDKYSSAMESFCDIESATILLKETDGMTAITTTKVNDAMKKIEDNFTESLCFMSYEIVGAHFNMCMN